MIKREARTERLEVRLTPADKEAIERGAAKFDMTSSEFVRAATLMMLVLEFDPHALRALGRGMTNAAREKIKAAVGALLWTGSGRDGGVGRS
jgi:hypothetical protein